MELGLERAQGVKDQWEITIYTYRYIWSKHLMLFNILSDVQNPEMSTALSSTSINYISVLFNLLSGAQYALVCDVSVCACIICVHVSAFACV